MDYNWDVRPILSEYCFRCHGPDEKARRANLRLDQAESAYAALAGRVERHAVIPGKPDESEMIRRVTHQTPALRMPPSVTNKVLTAEQIEILRQWIAQGAQYKPHWAYIPPAKPPVPQVKAASRSLTDIDRFVVSRLEREGLALSPQADKETLINRVSLSLTGLPPTLAEVDAFLKDTSATAYEKVVDRLLASPAYGERMAGYWLDVARYAESDGFLDDRHDRLFWPYRDWVIAAFNRNMPFDQFSTWQLAGDLMPSHTKEQQLATAFLRVGKRTTENGSIDEEYRVEYVVDRTNTIGTAFLGLTVGCARCHDHKYDPISHKDFYSLSGFFNSTDEPGFYAPGNTGITPGRPSTGPMRPLKQSWRRPTRWSAQREAAFDAVRATAAADAAAKAAALADAPADAAATVQQSLAANLAAHYAFEQTSPIPDDQLPASRPRRRMSPPVLEPLTQERNPFGQGPPPAPPAAAGAAAQAAANQPPHGRPAAGGGAHSAATCRRIWCATRWCSRPARWRACLPGSWRRRSSRTASRARRSTSTTPTAVCWAPTSATTSAHQPFSLDFWLLARAGVRGLGGPQQPRERQQRQRWLRAEAREEPAALRRHALARRRPHLGGHQGGGAGEEVGARHRHLRRIEPRPGVGLYLDGARLDVDVVSDNLTRTIIPNGGGTLGDEYLGLQFGKRFRMTTLKDGAIDEIRVFKKALSPLEIRYAAGSGRGVRRSRGRAPDVIEVLVASDPRVVAAAAQLAEARDAQNKIVSVLPEVMVMGDTPTPRPTYVLLRGQYTDHGDEVQPQGLSQIFPVGRRAAEEPAGPGVAGSSIRRTR